MLRTLVLALSVSMFGSNAFANSNTTKSQVEYIKQHVQSQPDINHCSNGKSGVEKVFFKMQNTQRVTNRVCITSNGDIHITQTVKRFRYTLIGHYFDKGGNGSLERAESLPSFMDEDGYVFDTRQPTTFVNESAALIDWTSGVEYLYKNM